MRRFSTPSRRRPGAPSSWESGLSAATFVVLSTLFAVGCVSEGIHTEVVTERDALKERVRLLEASQESLDGERVRLLDELEDLREEKHGLGREVRQLRKTEKQLAGSLAETEAELASRDRELNELRGTYEGLVSDLESEVASGQIEIQQLRDGLRLNMRQDVLFPSGSTQVNAGGRVVLAKVAERMKDLPHRVIVQGHTDNVPIRSKRYPSNWELAGARAAGVVRLLVDGGIAPERVSAVSFGEYAPRAPNDTPEGRARNRRIEITLRPPGTGDAQPAPGTEGGTEDGAEAAGEQAASAEQGATPPVEDGSAAPSDDGSAAP